MKTSPDEILKDNIPPEKKSGKYQINCKIARRCIYGRQKEIWKLGLKNILKYKNGEIEKSAVIAHVWKEKYAIDPKSVLLKHYYYYYWSLY